MKILYISDSTIPSFSANSIHVMKMCQAFSKNALEVTLIGKRTRVQLVEIHDIYSFYGVNNIFKIKLFPFKAFPFSGRIYNLLIPFFAFIKSDFVYTRAIYPAFWYTLFNKKIAFEIHEPYDTKSIWLKILFQFIVKRGKVKKWIVISAPLKKYLINHFAIPESNILIAHDGADQIRQKLKDHNLKNKKIKIGYVGSLLKGKGMELIFELIKILPDIEFHVVGGQDAQINFWKQKLEMNQSNIQFYGFQAPKKAVEFMFGFDILIAPYLNEIYVKNKDNSNNIATWMSPLKLFEYMAVGKPIITSKLPVIEEFLEDKKTAILCNPEKISEWVEAIQFIKSNPDFAYKMGQRAKEEFEKNYSWDKRAENILTFLKN